MVKGIKRRGITMKMMKKSEVAQMLKVKASTIDRWLRQDRFMAPVRIGKESLWPEDELIQWLMRQRKV
jgi:predicted DNA-binding transcriptional regulator AlpA